MRQAAVPSARWRRMTVACSASAPPRCCRRCSIRHFRRLWLADMVSLLGDWAGRLALAVLVLERTGSPAWAAAVTAVSLAGLRRHRPGARHPRRPPRPRRGHARRRRRPGRALRRHAPPDPGRRAARAGVPRRARHPAVRGGPLRGPPRPRARGPLRRGARPGRHLGAVVAGHRLRARRRCCSPWSTPEVALAINAVSFLVSAMLLLGLRHTAGRRAGRGAGHRRAARSATAPRRSSATAWCGGRS